MIKELFELLPLDKGSFSMLNFMNQSSFDEMVGVDLENDRFRFIYNIEEKYQVPATEGTFHNFIEYMVEHLVYPQDVPGFMRYMDPAVLQRRLEESEIPGVLDFTYRMRTIDGGWIWAELVALGAPADSLPRGVVYCYLFDIQNIKNRETGLSRVRREDASRHDSLTGLMREKDFYSAAEARLSQGDALYDMVSIDLEAFKLFNDWYGQKNGDLVLARIGAGLLQAAERLSGLAAYMGSDDFCLLVPNGAADYQKLFEDIHNVVVRYGGSNCFQPALGVSVSDGKTPVLGLLDQASLACQQAKRDFRHRVCFFTPSMYRQTAEDYRLLSDFQSALKSGEITFYLQPQCLAGNGRIVGAEALARWVRPDGEMVMPGKFVPVLEKYGFITDLDKHVWESVCRWLGAGGPKLPVSVNVSAVDLFTMDVPAFMIDVTGRFGVDRSLLKIEITESSYGEGSERARAVVRTLREAGFTVLMDDFGSGYSSLNMLRELNIDIVKLDANFLRMDDATVKKGMNILESIVNMTQTMGLPTVIEGVETQEQNEYMMSLGCCYIQGYYFYKPMPVKDFEALAADPEKVDHSGMYFRANEQFRIREFLNDTVYSDSMLNNIIGPAAIYAWHGDDVDIVRYNQQFYLAVNVEDFAERLRGIQQFMPPGDQRRMAALLAKAEEDRLNGASGVLSFKRSQGGYSRFYIHFYYLNGDENSRRFYGAARDVTEITNLHQQMDLIARFTSHCVIFLLRRDSGYHFEVGAQGMEKEMGLDKDALRQELNSGAFFMRVAPEDAQRMLAFTRRCVSEPRGISERFRLVNTRGETLRLFMRSDYVDDENSDVLRILLIRNDEE